MDSYELAEWKAYERFAGPLDDMWRDEVLAGLHEQLQQLNYLFSQANFTDKSHKKGPVAKPEQYVRPGQIHDAVKKKAQEEQEDFRVIPD